MKQKSRIWLFHMASLLILVNLMPGWRLAGVGARIWLVWLIVAAGGALLLVGGCRRSRKWTALDCMLGGCLVWNFLQIIGSAVKMEACEEGNISVMGLVILFFYASVIEISCRVLMKALLVCAVPVYIRLLWYFLVNPSNAFNIMPLLEGEALPSFLLIIAVAAAEGYCSGWSREAKTEKRAGIRDGFYMGMAFVSYFLLFLDGNMIGILLVGMSFPVSILLHRPEKEFVRRTMQMAFVCFFLLSNMSLLVNYTALVKVEVVYYLEDSVYLELLIALAGVLFFSWWDKLPEGEGVILHGLQKGTVWVLSGAGVCLFLLLAMGSRLEGMQDGMSMTLLHRFTDALREYCAGHNGSFYDALAAGGVVGGLWLICTCLLLAGRLMRQVRLKRAGSAAAMAVVLYLAQSLFFSQRAASAPIYVVLLASALCGREDGQGDDAAAQLWCGMKEWLRGRRIFKKRHLEKNHQTGKMKESG